MRSRSEVEDLVRAHRVREQLEPAAVVGVRSVASGRLDGVEQIAVGERIRERELGVGAAPRVLVRGIDVRFPPRDVAGERQRAKPLFRGVDQRQGVLQEACTRRSRIPLSILKHPRCSIGTEH